MFDQILHFIFGTGVCTAFDPITLTGLAVSLGGSIFGAAGSASANRKRQAALDAQKAESNAFFNKELYQDELNRSENQAVMRTLANQFKDQNKQNQATAAITGATPEVAVAQQGQMNKSYADVANRIAGNASMRKDNVRRQWMGDKRQLYAMQDALDADRQSTWSNFATNASQLGGNAIGMLGGGSNAASAVSAAAPKVELNTNLLNKIGQDGERMFNQLNR